jgi:hypothetical protein
MSWFYVSTYYRVINSTTSYLAMCNPAFRKNANEHVPPRSSRLWVRRLRARGGGDNVTWSHFPNNAGERKNVTVTC